MSLSPRKSLSQKLHYGANTQMKCNNQLPYIFQASLLMCTSIQMSPDW